MALKQGGQFYENMMNKVKNIFSAGEKEGFNGILGSNSAMDNTISSETANTNTSRANFNNNIAQYGTDYAALQKKTDEYIKDKSNDYELKKNYNVFINKNSNEGEIPEKRQQGCVTAASAQASIKNITNGNFSAAYPNNFTNFAEAKSACKLWAADNKQTVFALNQDNTGKYQCYMGTDLTTTSLIQYTKPAMIYNVLSGDKSALQGGLFRNGQIGTWTGKVESKTWNIPNMNKPSLISKFNSSDYSNGPQPLHPGTWGAPSQGGWGINVWPNDNSAWWLSTSNWSYVGTMGYFYYVYNSPAAKTIVIYAIVDDNCVLKINGTMITMIGKYGTGGRVYLANIPAGKNVFELELINTGGPAAFVFYAADSPNYRSLLFSSTTTGWGYTSTPVPNYNLITNLTVDPKNPDGLTTLNPVPTGYTNCDILVGGGVNKNTITATYGRNCSSDTQPPLNVRYVTVRANVNGDCLQISQIVVNALVNGSIVNVAPNGTIVYASPSWSNMTNPKTAIDGTLAPRAHPNIYHSICRKGTGWSLDLGQTYPVTQIKYYNRSDCCSQRANGMKIYLIDESKNNILKVLTLTGALEQSFNISTGTSSAIETKTVNGNNGTVSCDRFCGGYDGHMWHPGTLPGYWKGSICTAAGVNLNLPCDESGLEAGQSVRPCQCAQSDSTPWAA
jgi:hypothetical protein